MAVFARHKLSTSVTVLAVALAAAPAGAAMGVYSAGMVTPETISPVPAGVYGGAYNGGYFIPDPARGVTDAANWKVWFVAAGGGAPQVFAQGMDTPPVGGVFLPASWGADAGKYATVGYVVDGTTPMGRINIYEANGTYNRFWELPGMAPKTPMMANSWGVYGDQMIIADGGPGVYAVSSAGGRTQISNTVTNPARFGLAVAPGGWGTVGGKLLATRSSNGDIFSIATNGTETLWTTVPILPGQNGCRHMAFGPAGFIPGYGTLLYVSISGSTYGGGTLGDVLAVDSAGSVVASIRDLDSLTKFDPRGLYFTPAGGLLISDASDPILLAISEDFEIVPEPGTLSLLALGALGALVRRRRR